MKQIKDSGPRHKLTFKEFEDHTDDAWDATDDDLLKTLQKVELNKVEQVNEKPSWYRRSYNKSIHSL